MGWQNTVLQLTPLIVDLVQIAEKAFAHVPKSGKQKRNFVCSATKDIIAGGTQVATGGAKDTWSFIDKTAPSLIDVIAKHFFPDHGRVETNVREQKATEPLLKPVDNQFIDNDKYR